MERKYLMYGIDLGTTNSCIATWDKDKMKVFLNKEQMAVTKSAVYYGKRKRTIVGYKAYNALATEPDNVAIEFKRIMGLQEKKYFPTADHYATPEELSAEVLKTLTNNVTTLTGDNVNSAVITVPAAFTTIQCEATIEAAKSAGIEYVHLLQEPIAAAIAYGTDRSLHDKTWLIFDLGGGTFDVAVVSSNDGQLQVLNHEGDNYLGGKDIDRALAERILFPALVSSGYKIIERTPLYERVMGRLIYEAEELKIQLTTKACVEYDIQIDDQDYEDEYGEPILLQGTVENKILHAILDDVILPKCIRLCNKAINDVNLAWSDIDRILLVGGPTQIPYIREVLKQTFLTDIDYSQNPMTVVAAGAAMYASVTKIPETIEIKPIDSKNNNTIDVNYEYETIMSTLNGTVYGTFNNRLGVKEVMLSSNDASWTSGWVPLMDLDSGYFEIDVVVKEHKQNLFNLQARDNRGNMVTVNNSLVEIKHSYNYLQPANPPLPHTISMEVETDEAFKNTKLEPIFNKNAVLPLTVTRKVLTTNAVLPNDENTFFSIRVYEGEVLDNPSVNTLIFTMIINGGSFSTIIPKNEEVEVTISISESREIGLELFIPRLNEVITKTHIYFPEKSRANTITDSLEASIKNYYEEIHELQEDFLSNNLKNESLQLSKIEEYLEQFANQFYKNKERMSNSADLAMAELTRFKDSIVIPIHKLQFDHEKRTASSQGIKEEEIENLVEETERLVYEFDNATITNNFQFLKENLKKATEFKNDRLIEKYFNQLRDIQLHIVREDPAFWMELYSYVSNIGVYTDQRVAEDYIRLGREAIFHDDLEKLKRVVHSLYGILPKEVVETIEENKQLPGIRLLR